MKIALVYHGDRKARSTATTENSRYAPVFAALAKLGAHAEPAVYNDEFADEVQSQLENMDGVLVWVNPIESGHDRTVLDGILRKIAVSGVFVSAHPDVILKIGTKEVLYRTREMEWGSDIHLYSKLEQLLEQLAVKLARGETRVLKQYRGNGGIGVWKVQRVPGEGSLGLDSKIRVRHAQRGCIEEEIKFNEFLKRCEHYFTGEGRVIDQLYQPRLPEGMIRCYLVQNKVAGFGHQAINALYPAESGTSPQDAPQPGPRLYHPPTKPEFQALKNKMESKWVPQLQQLLKIETSSLPLIWDADFLLGPKDAAGQDTYVLCEINASCVSPFPDEALPVLAQTAVAQVAQKVSGRT